VQTFNKGVSDTTIYDEAAVKEKYGLAPDQLIDYKALVGDASDNIKGVPGVGPKTAVELIKKFGTVKKLYEALDGTENGEGLEKLRARFGAFKKEAKLSEMLVTLERHAPIEIPPLAELAPEDGTDGAANYFERMGFHTLLKRLLFGAPDERPAAAKAEKEPKRKKEKPLAPRTPLF